MARKKCKQFRRVYARVTVEDYKRLESIAKNYEFKSVYQILNYLTYVFLRVADRENDAVADPVPEEIEEMFSELSDGRVPVAWRRAKPMRRSTDQE